MQEGTSCLFHVQSIESRSRERELRRFMQIIADDIVEVASNYNETEVRFHIIDPILRRLGYPGDDSVYLNLEEKLEYPYVHIGRRSKKDLPLGFPDYRAGLKGARGSFVVEAKAGNVQIGPQHVEQAHSYAAHAQVGANYFVLCNGKVFSVYQTLSGPDFAPIARGPIYLFDPAAESGKMPAWKTSRTNHQPCKRCWRAPTSLVNRSLTAHLRLRRQPQSTTRRAYGLVIC